MVNTRTSFWPREPGLWVLHGAVLLFITAVTLASFAVWGRIDAPLLWRTGAWPLPYTLAVLGWRWLSGHGGWDGKPLPWQVLAVLLYSTGAGVAVVAAIELPLQALGLIPPQSGSELLRSVLSGGLQSQLFIAAWAFVHVGHGQRLQAQEAELAALRLQTHLHQAQLRALVQQLNPHFLFNALNNLRFLVHEDAHQAEGAVVALSSLLRQALQSSQKDKVLLAEELALVHQQLSLHRLQLEQRLQLRLVIEPDLERARLPPLTLQLLVENAVKHGLEPLPAGGVLEMQVSSESGRLHLSVRNPRPAAATGERLGLSLGLDNLKQRLALLYGADARLSVRPAATHFEVEIDLPLELAPP